MCSKSIVIQNKLHFSFAAIKMGFANDLQSEESAGIEQEKEQLSVKEASITQAGAWHVDVAEATATVSTSKASGGVPSTDALIAEKNIGWFKACF